MRERKFTEQQFREAVSSSSNRFEVFEKLGLSTKSGENYCSFNKYVKEWNVDISHFKGLDWSKDLRFGFKNSIDDYFSGKIKIGSHNLKIRLFKEGLKNKQCENCNLTEWLGESIPLELDHIDGNKSNNNLSNLRILCPNCHAKTPTYGIRNRKKM